MRHFLKLRKLSRTSSHIKSMLFNLSNSLIKYELIKTTLCKAKELRGVLEPMINISKVFSIFNIRFLFSKLRNMDSVFKLIKILGPRYRNRKGGYLRIYKSGFRHGDNASLALVQLL